jgi:hypothetical protein
MRACSIFQVAVTNTTMALSGAELERRRLRVDHTPWNPIGHDEGGAIPLPRSVRRRLMQAQASACSGGGVPLLRWERPHPLERDAFKAISEVWVDLKPWNEARGARKSVVRMEALRARVKEAGFFIPSSRYSCVFLMFCLFDWFLFSLCSFFAGTTTTTSRKSTRPPTWRVQQGSTST